MQVVKGLHSLVHYRRDIARPRTVNFLSRAAGEDFWKQRVVRLPAREPPHPPTPSLPTTVHLAFRFVSDETRQKQDCNLHGTGCPASPGSKVPYPMHSRRSNNAYQVRPVTGQYTHTHTYTHTPTQTRAYKGACFNISSGHTQVWFPPCDACNHKKERKMLKITFNSSNTWGRWAETSSQWLEPCRGNWAVPVLIIKWFRLSQTPLVRDATEDWERNFPSCSFATFSAPCAVAVGKET